MKETSNESAEKNHNTVMPKTEKTKPKFVLHLDISDQNRLRHRLTILESLVSLRVAAHKKMCRLPKENIPQTDKKYLKTRFMIVLNDTDKYMTQMTHMRGLTFASIYANLYQLEKQFNADIQKYIDISTKYKDKQGVFYTCMNFIR